MSGLDKTLASLSGFYYTDAEETSSYQKADLPEQTDLSLLDYADTATDCTSFILRYAQFADRHFYTK